MIRRKTAPPRGLLRSVIAAPAKTTHTDSIASVRSVFGRDGVGLSNAVLAARTDASRVAIVEEFLRQRLRRDSQVVRVADLVYSVATDRTILKVDDLVGLCKRHGLQIRWFDRKPVLARDNDHEVRSVVRSFFEPPGTIYLNKALQSEAPRLKFDLASHIGHKVLHGGDGVKSSHATGGEMGESPDSGFRGGIEARDILLAWRDFECSFFAGALLCPKVPFRRFLIRERYRIEASRRLELTPAVMMRRMTKVSPYPYWHFFDANAPGHFRAVYRGNGIPLPWGSMTQATDPCPHWAVFRMLGNARNESSSQLSLLRENDQWLLYCCHTLRTRDMAGNPHVLSVGVDLVPALSSNEPDVAEIVDGIAAECLRKGGEARLGQTAAEAIRAVAHILSIAWVEESLQQPARIICPRGSRCPRQGQCEGTPATRARDIADVKQEILKTVK